MRFVCSLSIIILILLCASCQHKPRGRRVMTHEDSVKRQAAIAEEAHLTEMEKIRESLVGPAGIAGSGEISKGNGISKDAVDEKTAAIIKSFKKYNDKLTLALKDSSTSFGPLMSRFNIEDSMHRYMSGTYSNNGSLLTFHSEFSPDDKTKNDYDLYFDKGVLVFFHERHTYIGEEDEQDKITDDSYYMKGDTLLYSYRDEGQAPHRRDHMDLIPLSRYSLRGDILGHVSQAFDTFQREYTDLLAQPLEMMVYTPPVRIQMPEVPADKKAPTKGPAF
jgi:hypothetical protein